MKIPKVISMRQYLCLSVVVHNALLLVGVVACDDGQGDISLFLRFRSFMNSILVRVLLTLRVKGFIWIQRPICQICEEAGDMSKSKTAVIAGADELDPGLFNRRRN